MKSILLIFILVQSLSIFASNLKEIDKVRRNCRQDFIDKVSSRSNNNKSIIRNGDFAENLVDFPQKMVVSLIEMDDKKLLSKFVSHSPWSDSYWPIFEGILGNRFNDPQYHFGNWKDAYDYIQHNPAQELIQRKQFDYLSPSEKYDYILGMVQEKNNLTNAQWLEGKSYQDESGSVETWMGLCHGWAAASIMTPAPEKHVEVNFNGDIINFNLSDIKGLSTLLWAKGEFEARFIGGRCNTKGPKVDHLGRPIELDCLDTNPGTWHLAIVNQIGLFDRSFIMDATYDYQVWNQPIFGYDYSYVNPISKKVSKDINESMIIAKDWKEDPRKSVRSPNAKFIVGIKMQVRYVSENSPNNDQQQDVVYSNAYYSYDLELDSKYKIIGGEWYSNNHPDFLWIPAIGSFPLTYGDIPGLRVNLSNIEGEIKENAFINAKYELPFGAIVRELINQSQNY